MVALEAMLCGCPVIGSNVGGLKDLILKGETGYLFERGNSKALCAILSGILRNKVDRSLMRVKAYNWAKHFHKKKPYPLYWIFIIKTFKIYLIFGDVRDTN